MISLFLILILFKIFTSPAFSANEFNLKQTITYTINRSGSATINQENKLINNFSQIYAQEYVIQLSGTDIQNIIGTDSGGSIVKSVQKDGDQTIIYLKFNHPAIGKDNYTSFELNYQVPQFAVNKGKIWEISLPEFRNQQESDTISTNLIIPTSFGKISFSSIPLGSVNQMSSNYHININQSSLVNQKILLIFGDFQLFDFDLTFYLNNDSSDFISTQIAIPPDTENQRLIYTLIEPQPINVTQDNDGNWLALYYLDPNQIIEVKVAGQVKISPLKTTFENINTNSLTQEQEYWPISHPRIQEIAANLSTPKSIYDYVTQTLSYDYDRINSAKRKGALLALENPSNSLCTEFTDLFVTLARAKGIPSREIQGFAYTNNPKIKPTNTNADILHAWPQYFDQTSKQWISIDPTWGKTTNGIEYFHDLDLNHFTFVIHGEDSSLPPPPGSYKDDRNIKTVDVRFAQNEINPPEILPLKLTPINIGLNQNPSIIIKNPNFTAISNIDISGIGFEFGHHIATLPPLGSIEIDIPKIPFLKSLLPHNQVIKLLISTDTGHNQTAEVKYLPHFLNLAIIILGIIFTISTGAIIFLLKKRK